MAVDVSAYAKELIESAGLTSVEEKAAFEKFLANDKVKDRLLNTLNDVERERGRTVVEKKRADEENRLRNEDYQRNLKLANDNKAIVDQASAQVQKYVELYGELPGGGNPDDRRAHAAAVQGVIDEKTFNERLGKLEQNTVGLLGQALKLMDIHRREFPSDPFPVDEIVKTATEKGMTVSQAYDSLMGEKRTATQTAASQVALAAAREEGAREERSKRAAGSVIDTQPKSEFRANWKESHTPGTALDNFRQAWNAPVADAKTAMQKEFGRSS